MEFRTIFVILFLILPTNSFSNDSTGVKYYLKRQKFGKVYRIRPWVNGTIIVGGFVANRIGVDQLIHKPGVSAEEVMQLSPADVNAFDRRASKQNPAVANNALSISNWVLNGAIVAPFFLAFDKSIRKDAVNVTVVYMTSISIMINVYAWGVGHIDRFRPYVFNTEESLARRTKDGSRNSFYAGHVAATATCTFFAAKVYHDYNIGSKLTPYIYAAAAIPPAICGFYRYRAGMHFPTDVIAGYIAGAAMGIGIPHLHKIKSKNLSFYPAPGGFGMTYRF